MKALTAKGNLQQCKSFFEAGRKEYRIGVEEIDVPQGTFDVSIGVTTAPVVCEDDQNGGTISYIDMKDALEEDITNQASLFFSFPVEVHTEGEEIVISVV